MKENYHIFLNILFLMKNSLAGPHTGHEIPHLISWMNGCNKDDIVLVGTLLFIRMRDLQELLLLLQYFLRYSNRMFSLIPLSS